MNLHAQAFNNYTSTHYTSNATSPYQQFPDYSQPHLYGAPSTPESYIHTSEVVILEPQSFSEIPSAVHILRNNQVVVLNLVKMANEEAQRSVDFIAVGAYMYQGSLEKIDINIFLFTPRNTNIRVESRQEQTSSYLSPELPSQNFQSDTSNRPSHYSLTHQAS